MIDAPAPAAGAGMPDAAELTRLAKAHAFALGFDLVGVAALGPAESAPAFEEWLHAGHAGTMDYLARGAEKRRDTRRPLPGTTHSSFVPYRIQALPRTT